MCIGVGPGRAVMETWLRGSERLGPLGRERRLRQPLLHVSCTSSQAGEGASGALPSACALHDLWPQSEVRGGLGEEEPEGMDSRAELCGASVGTSVSCLGLDGGTASSSLWSRRERAI